LIHADTPQELKEWIQIVETNIHWLNENQEYVDPRLTIKQVTLSAEKEGINSLNKKVNALGFLFMLSKKGVIKEYKKHYCVLQENSIYYFNNRTDISPVGDINLRGTTVKRIHNKPNHKYSFEIYTPDGDTYSFYADRYTFIVAMVTQ
jgi:hypothetical protein